MIYFFGSATKKKYHASSGISMYNYSRNAARNQADYTAHFKGKRAPSRSPYQAGIPVVSHACLKLIRNREPLVRPS